MKKLIIIIYVLVVSVSNAQFRDELDKKPDIRSGIVKNNSFGSILGFINPDNFSMRHSFNLSYSTFGGSGLALGVYTNSMAYKFSDKLDLQTDISIVNSPYNSLGQDFAKQINGVYLSRVQMNYKPADNMSIIIQYRNIPGGFYPSYYYGGYSPFYRGNFFGSSLFEK